VAVRGFTICTVGKKHQRDGQRNVDVVMTGDRAGSIRCHCRREWMRVGRKTRSVNVTPLGYGRVRTELGLEIRKPG
jgi:hypothetical protein